MLFTWDRTVSWDMNNRSPVCGIVYPRVSKSTTSISLNVNPYDSFIHSRLEHSAFGGWDDFGNAEGFLTAERKTVHPTRATAITNASAIATRLPAPKSTCGNKASKAAFGNGAVFE